MVFSFIKKNLLLSDKIIYLDFIYDTRTSSHLQQWNSISWRGDWALLMSSQLTAVCHFAVGCFNEHMLSMSALGQMEQHEGRIASTCDVTRSERRVGSRKDAKNKARQQTKEIELLIYMLLRRCQLYHLDIICRSQGQGSVFVCTTC